MEVIWISDIKKLANKVIVGNKHNLFLLMLIAYDEDTEQVLCFPLFSGSYLRRISGNLEF